MKYTKKHQIINIASSLPWAILIMHENFPGENERFEKIIEPQHDECSRALENQWNTYENVSKSMHVDKPYFNQGQSAFHKVA